MKQKYCKVSKSVIPNLYFRVEFFEGEEKKDTNWYGFDKPDEMADDISCWIDRGITPNEA